MNNGVYIFPGQGAQKPGMGKDFFEHRSAAKEVFQCADELLKEHFSDLIFHGDLKTLSQTNHAQLAIFITSIAILRVLEEEFPDLSPVGCGGLSLGEYSAITAAGITPFEAMIAVVKARGEFMANAAQKYPGTMAAILGLGEEEIEHSLSELRKQNHQVWIANINCPGQIVIAGSLQSIPIACEKLKQAGAKRALPLEVSGAFHTEFMGEAKERLKPFIEQMPLTEGTSAQLVSNVTGSFIQDVQSIKGYLIDQVVKPVRWEECIKSLDTLPARFYLEIGPSKTLAGMNRKIGVQKETISIEKLTDLDTLYEKVQS